MLAKYHIYQHPLGGQYLRLQSTETVNAVIVEGLNLLRNLPTLSLKLYFQSEFGDGEEIVINCVQIPQCQSIAVLFKDAEGEQEMCFAW